MTAFYQPWAKGSSWTGERATRFSRRIYTSRERAEAGIADFLKRLERRDDYDLGYLEAIDGVKIIELEVAK